MQPLNYQVLKAIRDIFASWISRAHQKEYFRKKGIVVTRLRRLGRTVRGRKKKREENEAQPRGLLPNIPTPPTTFFVEEGQKCLFPPFFFSG